MSAPLIGYIGFHPSSVLPWISLGYGLHILLFLLVVFHCFKYRRDPDSTLLWIVVSWTFPFVGPLLFAMFGVYRVPYKSMRASFALKNEREARAAEAAPLVYWKVVHQSLAVEPSESPAHDLNHAMNPLLPDYPLLGGNQIRALVTGDEAYPPMLEAIRAAREHIHLQSFIIGNDTIGRQFLDLLAEKAREGVKVRVLFDRFGSTHAVWEGLFRRYRKVPNLELAGWTEARLWRRQLQFNLRNHRKILVVDGRRAFTGGVNVSIAESSHDGEPAIRDYHFAIEGPIVQELQYSFIRDWHYMTDTPADELLRETYFPMIEPQGGALMRLINGGPSSEQETLSDVLFASIVAARKELLLVTPYFVPPDDLMRALRVVALRGVHVRLVVPRQNNHFYAGFAGQRLYEDLLAAGVRIFERRPPFMHSKAMIVDDALAVVGSANLDVRSLRLNYETNLAVFDAGFVDRLKAVILNDLSESDELSLNEWRNRPAYRVVLENACGLLAPIL